MAYSATHINLSYDDYCELDNAVYETTKQIEPKEHGGPTYFYDFPDSSTIAVCERRDDNKIYVFFAHTNVNIVFHKLPQG